MFDFEKYNPSCTVNFKTIRGDLRDVKNVNNNNNNKNNNRGTLETFILSLPTTPVQFLKHNTTWP